MQVAASQEYAALESDPPQRAKYLRSMEFTFAVISWVMKSPLTTVKRWVSNPTTTTVRGRRPLLTPEQDETIVGKVLDAARNHEALKPSAMRELVSSDPSFRMRIVSADCFLCRCKKPQASQVALPARGVIAG